MKALALFLMTLPLLACEPEGRLERAGEEIDEAIEDVRAGGETTGNRIDDAIDEVRDEIEDARD
jgi:hypothetical protein